MMRFIVSLVVGILPQAFFCTMMLCYIKDIRTRRLSLLLLVFLSMIVSIAIVERNIVLYAIFSMLVFGSLRLLYEKKAYWLDAICVLILMTIILLISFIAYLLIPTYQAALATTQLTLIVLPFLIRKPVKKLYIVYCGSWNTGGNKKIKSITVRNISVVLFNLAIVATNYAIIYYLTKLGGE